MAGINFDGIACPTTWFTNSNLLDDLGGSGSTYLNIKTQTDNHPLEKNKDDSM